MCLGDVTPLGDGGAALEGQQGAGRVEAEAAELAERRDLWDATRAEVLSPLNPEAHYGGEG